MSNLYIVATPIGNLQDITLRALEVLKSVDRVICEDTRVTGKLLHHFDIKKPLIALNEYNEEQIVYEILQLLAQGESLALVSDAGTPLISDPGFRLVRAAKQKNIPVIPIPGVSAAVTALSASGLPSDSFLFLGFLSKNKTKKAKLLAHIKATISKDYSPTIILYESPHRIVDTLQIILEIFGDIHMTVARELTKVYEEIETKQVSEWREKYQVAEPKGEITLLMSLKHH